jgi:hypothetical protein
MIQGKDINILIALDVEVSSSLREKGICHTVSHPNCILRQDI